MARKKKDVKVPVEVEQPEVLTHEARLKMALHELQGRIEQANGVLARFREEVAKPYNITDALEWHGEAAILAQEVLRLLDHWPEIILDQEKTWQERTGYVQKEIASLIRYLCEHDSFCCNNTCAIVNLANQKRFRAKQEALKVLTRALYWMEQTVTMVTGDFDQSEQGASL